MTEKHTDDVRFSRPTFLPGVELVSVRYRDRAFPEHSHAEWVVGAIMAGAETLVVEGVPHVVGAGQVLRLAPDQPHANSSIGPEVLRYRVAYVSREALAPYVDGGTIGRFDRPVVGDAAVHEAVAAAHELLSDDGVGRLEQESALAVLATTMFADQKRPDAGKAPEQRAIAAVRAYMDERFAEGFGLCALSEVARLSVFHLSRTFRQSVGLSPLAYRNQRRLVEAKRLLLAGQPIADVALTVGYADQSHLTRQFQRIVGVSPARYARDRTSGVQDSNTVQAGGGSAL